MISKYFFTAFIKHLITNKFIYTKLLVFIFLWPASTILHSNEIGRWLWDDKGLPVFEYTGGLPFSATDRDGEPARLPEDPWFLLGNYRFNLFAHVSGNYQIIAGDRAWARVNQGNEVNSGNSVSSTTVIRSGKTYQLSGPGSLAEKSASSKRIFGSGYASWQFEVDGLSIVRTLAVKPSERPNEGSSAFSITIQFTNTSRRAIEISHKEGYMLNYLNADLQRTLPSNRDLSYTYTPSENNSKSAAVVHINAQADDPMLFRGENKMAMTDVYPPSVFMMAVSDNASVRVINTDNDFHLHGETRFTIPSGKTVSVQWISGYYYSEDHHIPAQLAKSMALNPGETDSYLSATFSRQWKQVLPAFENETDMELRRELIWHAYVLEAMAQYSIHYGETKIPQGTIYDYDWGIHASARDNFQHALPLVWYNPELARSVLRFMIKRITPQGEVRLMERGNGYAHNDYYFTSDQQLYFFLLISEYLRVTGDYGFLSESVTVFPPAYDIRFTVLEVIKRAFGFLRDEVGTGPNGLVRLLNSDWNDAVYFIQYAPYNRAFHNAESHMNTTMVLAILPGLVTQLTTYANAQAQQWEKQTVFDLITSMEQYRSRIWDAFMADLGDRTFARRLYFHGQTFGEKNMFLEPQGFMLQIPELSLERKITLWEQMQKRLYEGEKLGARQQEDPEFISDEFEKGSRENGGFWYALNGPVIAGLNTFNREEAQRVFRMMTFQNYAKQFPQFWTSYWSAADNIESSLIPTEGLPDQTWIYWAIPVFCAHPHAWILYTYFLINE